jgi:hypothetical protein
LNDQRFNAIPETSESPDYPPHAGSRRTFTHRRTAFFVADPFVQDQPDEAAEAMHYCADGLIVRQLRDQATIHDFENASFGFDCRVRTLVENAPHVAVALRTRHFHAAARREIVTPRYKSASETTGWNAWTASHAFVNKLR